mmetsp:Transcript_14119/g.23972  ORF Transcript_14119/g.23972 Transcript_14119/m.23972 type:complete len:82 (-) Transcript_14119:28-273(-)
MVDSKEKTINAYTKTKLDWDKYVKESKQEGALEKNRKNGYLQKQKFLNDAKAVEYEYQKSIYKQQIKLHLQGKDPAASNPL